MMEILRRILDKLPFPIIVALAIIISAMWVIREFYGWDSYQEVFRNTIFLSICGLVVFGALTFYMLRIFIWSRREKVRKGSTLTGKGITEQVDIDRQEMVSINIDQMQGGTIFLSPAGYVKHSKETKFELQIGGVLYHDNCARFSLVSSGNGLFSVTRLYAKLHGYARCNLRDEHPRIAAFGGVSAYHFYISPEYSEYDIIPLRPVGDFGTWHYKEEDFDEFLIDFGCIPYTLYVISIELEAVDLKTNKEIKISSDLYRLIRVLHGNTGGCLDLEKWYKPELLELPKKRKYREDLSTFEYQLLTVNLDRDNSYLHDIDKETLLSVIPKLERIVKERGVNVVFEKNLHTIQEYIQAGIKKE